MMVETKLAASGTVPPIRTSPAVGSARNSISLTPCRNSSKAAWLRSEHGAPVFGELDAVRIALQQAHAEGVLQVVIERCHHRMRDGKLFAAFDMLPHCATARRTCRSRSLIRRPIRSLQRMLLSLTKTLNGCRIISTFPLKEKGHVATGKCMTAVHPQRRRQA